MNFTEDVFNMITTWLNEEEVWKLRQINKRTKQIIETDSLYMYDMQILYVYYNKYFYIYFQIRREFEIYYCSLESITFEIYDIIIRPIILIKHKHKCIDIFNNENILFNMYNCLKLDNYRTSQKVMTYLENIEKMIKKNIENDINI